MSLISLRRAVNSSLEAARFRFDRWFRPDPQFAYLPDKQLAELRFWQGEIKKMTRWYEGEMPEYYGISSPTDDMKETAFDLRQNAIRTWIPFMMKRYLNSLQVGPDYFSGCRILDVGCGPLPLLHAFEDVECFGVDQLTKEYRAIGFPLDSYDPPVNYLVGSAEKIPTDDDTFDAIVSVNAIDHVDDFGEAAMEILRILKPGGKLRMQIHYHHATRCEPWQLDDQMIAHHFGGAGLKKIDEQEVPGRSDERLTLWTN